ncbi:hypothetical protein M408DRAFT_115953 [Serendipita vermifera MAFF 305830]|uniref:GRAM domain-containing protein n=1 Tax=Serendipita vermifera MAFF 305830 TaxID=933852 RepID=A0A0C2WTY0_SERVB|nr:hypothetical protein M408DRAFT_115953 [Serendipita vermifera MAFF 305830]
MSINWVELNPQRQPLPIGQERFIHGSRLLEAKAKISSPIPTQPRREGNASTGTEFGAAGTAYLSDMRLVFISNNGQVSESSDTFSTFSVLFSSIVGTKYQQPWFGGNYIEVTFKPTPDGGLPVGALATVTLRVDGGGLYEFCAALQQRMEAARVKHQESNTLPVYTPSRDNTTRPADSSTAPHILDASNELPPAYTI